MRITNHHVIFEIADAEIVVEALRKSADEGETFELVRNPQVGKRTAIIARYFDGVFEGYF